MNISSENLAKLRLLRTNGLGPISIRRLLLRYGNAQNTIAESHAWAKPTTRIATADAVEQEVATLAKASGWMVFWGEPDYPTSLHDLPDAPLVLCGLGDKAALKARQVAIVGNRSASASGLQWAKQAAADFARAHVIVTSGLARGVDTAAHQGALEAGGQTIAVVAGGLDSIYPPENANLRAQIIANGCVITEQPWGMAPNANLFPQRNRIIAGLSLGVVVSEATRHSGSLITADYALEYGREIWAVPGTPADQRSAGPNWLLKNGATLIETAADVLSQLPHTTAPYVKQFRAQPNLFPEEQSRTADDLLATETETAQPARTRLYALLNNTPIAFDNLVRQTGLSEAEANVLLTELEIEGHATREADGRWRRGA